MPKHPAAKAQRVDAAVHERGHKPDGTEARSHHGGHPAQPGDLDQQHANNCADSEVLKKAFVAHC